MNAPRIREQEIDKLSNVSTAELKAVEQIAAISTEAQPKEHAHETSKSPTELADFKLLKTIVVTDCSAFTTSQRVKYLFTLTNFCKLYTISVQFD